MKFSLLSLAILSVFIFTSCQKNDLAKDKVDDKETYKDKEDKEDCFKLVYPLSYTLPDGSVVSGDEDNLWTAIKDWYDANPETEEKPELNYPVDIIFEDGTTLHVENEEAMIIVKEENCEDGE